MFYPNITIIKEKIWKKYKKKKEKESLKQTLYKNYISFP